MYGEVRDWLYSIGLEHLYDYFIQDGFTTLDAVRNMRQSDIDTIVDRHGYMVVLNEEIDRLNYGDSLPAAPAAAVASYAQTSGNRYERASSYVNSDYEYEPRENLLNRYETGGIPAVGFASRHLARRAKSKTRKTRAGSAFPALGGSRSSAERYIPNSASDAFESYMVSKRAASVAVAAAREAELNNAAARIEERVRRREEDRLDRQQRAKTGKLMLLTNELSNTNHFDLLKKPLSWKSLFNVLNKQRKRTKIRLITFTYDID